jgi:predicted nucleic acid-binding protein
VILVDTSVWSFALRRRREQLNPLELRVVAKWTRLALDGDAVLIGPIRQEVLSGIRHQAQFANLQQRLNDFPCFDMLQSDYDRAAQCFNTCRANGIAPGAIDMIICASAIQHDVPVMTTDPDFSRYEKHLPIQLLPL